MSLIEALAVAGRCLPRAPSPDQVVTVLLWRFAVLDMAWKPKLGKWVLLRVLKNLVA